MTNENKGVQGALKSAKEELAGIDKDMKPKTYARQEKVVKAYEIALNQSIRAKRAEMPEKKKTSKNSGEETPKNDKKFSLDEINEITTLSEIHKDDREEVYDYAERKGIKVSETLAQPFIKSFLKEREEERKSQKVSNTNKGGKKIFKTSEKRLLEQLEKGELPEDDINAAVKANIKQMKKGN